LRVLVVNDPELVEGINRVRGEWAERSGGELAASATTWRDLEKLQAIDADVIIFPSRYLGELSTRNWLRPIRASVLESEDLKFADFFPLVRNELIKWGGQTMALPLGLDPNLLDISPAQGRAMVLLREAAPQAVSKDKLGVLFDVETMKPRITEPAFIEALTKLAAEQVDTREKGATQIDTATRADDSTPRDIATPSTPVLGYTDRLIGVTTSSHNAASAFKLISWLAQPDTSAQLARLGNGTLPPRVSNAASPAWYKPDVSAEDRAKSADTLTAQLSGERSLLIPRIPGIDDYVAALDEAVKPAKDAASAATAIQHAAERWEQITESRGRDAQLQAYRKSLGLTE
jgi:hypothetical protein